MPGILGPIVTPPFNPFGGNTPGPGNLASWDLHPGGLYTSPWGANPSMIGGGSGGVASLWNPSGNASNTNFNSGLYSAGFDSGWGTRLRTTEFESRGADRAGSEHQGRYSNFGFGGNSLLSGSNGYDPGFMRASSYNSMFFGGKQKPQNPFQYF